MSERDEIVQKLGNDGYRVSLYFQYLDMYGDSGFYVVNHGNDNTTFDSRPEAQAAFDQIS